VLYSTWDRKTYWVLACVCYHPFTVVRTANFMSQIQVWVLFVCLDAIFLSNREQKCVVVTYF